MDFFGNIGKFFGFNQPKKKEEKRREPATRQPLLPTAMQIPSQNTGGVQMPQPFAMGAAPIVQAPQLGGVKPAESNILKDIGAGFQQQLGRATDLAVQGGGTLQMLGTEINPFIDEERRRKQTQADLASVEALRSGINGWRDINGNSIVGNRDVDAAGGRLASGQINAQDLAAVGGRGLDVAGTATMAINPLRTLSGAAVNTGSKIAAIKALAPAVGREALVYGGLEGTQASADTYGQTGDLGESVKQFAPNFALGAVSQVGLEAAAYGAGRAIRGVAGRTPLLRRVEETAANLVDESGRPTIAEPPVTPPREPGNPITSSPTTNKAPAITSANPNFVPPTVTQPQPFDIGTGQAPNTPPQLGGVAPLRAPEPAPVVNQAQLADEQAIQEIIDQAAVRPPVAPPEVVSAPVETPLMAQSRAAANEAPPINPEIIADAVRAERAAQAPTEAIADRVGITKDDNYDSSLTKLDNALDEGRISYDEHAAIEDTLFNKAEKSGDVIAAEAGDTPRYASPHRTGKAGVPGNAKVNYNTGDANLDGIVNDSIIASKGTAGTASSRAEALDATGISSAQQKRIRDLAVKNVDKNTGRVSIEAQEKIRQIIMGTEVTPPRVEPIRMPDAKPPVAKQVKEAPPTEPTDKLGTISRKAATEGRLTSDTESQALATRVGDAIDAEAKQLGTTWEKINKKVQEAWSKNITDPAEAGLTPAEFDLSKRAASETSFLRDRIDPALIKGGKIDKFYSPRQTEDTVFTQKLVNEISRSKTGGLADSELDLSSTPYRDVVRRYSNADTAMKDQLVDLVETKTVKNANGDDVAEATGIKVSEKAKADVQEHTKAYVQAQDDATRALDDGDTQSFEDAIKRGDKAINDAINRISDDIPLDMAGRDAIDSVKGSRQAYMQSTMRTNMFLNIANRSFDQVGKAYVTGSDKVLMGVAKKVASKIVGDKAAPLMPGDKVINKIAKKYSKGALLSQQNRNLKTNVSLAGAGQNNPILKGVAKLDAAYRGIGTYGTSLGDLATTATRETDLAILRQGKESGLTSPAELEKYLTDRKGTSEYDNIYRRVENSYAGYIGMPESLTGPVPSTGKISKFFSQADNIVKKSLENAPIPNRLKQELNDSIMPFLTGFSGSVSRMAKKGINAGALGIPQIRAGLKMAASDEPGARAVGELMIARSLIDATAAAGLGGAGIALGATGSWTGSYPDDPSEAARWQKEGIQPEAFQFDVDGKTVYIQPGRLLGPLALPMVAPTVVAHAIAQGNSPQDALGQMFSGTLGQFMQNMGVDAMGQSIKNVYDLGTGREYEKKRAGENLLKTLGFAISNAVTPAAGLQNNVANAADDTKREVNTPLDVVKSRNPFTRESLPAKTDTLGNPIRNTTQMSLGSSAVTVGDGQGEKKPVDNVDSSLNVDDEINRLSKADFEVMPGKDVKNANSQSDATLLLNSAMYKGASDEGKADFLKETLLGNKTKDISTSLSPEERGSLIEYTLQSDAKRKAWLDDNANAASYYGADYNNAKANSTLTVDDDNLQNKSGKKYKSLRANVNQEVKADKALQLLYEDISPTEWKAMIDPDSEDYDLPTANRLFNYDEARTKAGVSGKSADSSKPKFGQKKAGKGGKGGGGGKSDNFAFASLPGSLLGNSAGSGKSGYADNAPTFKPIADLQAPATVVIPKGRNISVKKGIQL